MYHVIIKKTKKTKKGLSEKLTLRQTPKKESMDDPFLLKYFFNMPQKTTKKNNKNKNYLNSN
jgi:hypothetical protein